MLQIQSETLQALTERRRVEFVERLVRHLRECFPERCLGIDDLGMGEFISAAIHKAEANGMVTEREVARFVDLMVAFHPNFDRDPAMPWVGPILADRQRPARARLDRLFAALLHECGIRAV